MRLSRLPGKGISKKEIENHRRGEGRIQFWASEDILKIIFQFSCLSSLMEQWRGKPKLSCVLCTPSFPKAARHGVLGPRRNP